MAFESPQLRFAILATDVVLFSIKDGELLVRLITVDRPPHFPSTKGMPGQLLHPKESAEEGVSRLIDTKAAIDSKKVYIEQLYTFSEVGRDPRGRIVSLAYLGLVPWEELSEVERTDEKNVWWSRVKDCKKMAYDHDAIFEMALKRLASRVTYTTLIAKLMSAEFTLTELESAYKSILGVHLDKRNFRKKILKLGILKELPDKRRGGRSRPAQLFKFASQKINEIEIL